MKSLMQHNEMFEQGNKKSEKDDMRGIDKTIYMFRKIIGWLNK